MTDSLASRLFEAKLANDLAPAFVQGQTVITHRQLRSLVVACANQLKAMGLVGGELIGLTMGQSPLFCVTQLALAVLGVVHLPLLPSLRRHEQINLLKNFGASKVLTDREIDPFPGVHTFFLDNLSVATRGTAFERFEYSVGPETPLSIALTSGTTGSPKGLLRTHASLLDRIDSSPMPLGPGARMIPPDLHQAISQCYSSGMLLHGGTLVFPASYQLESMIQAIALYGVTHLILSPAKAREMAELLPENAGALSGVTHLRLMGGHPSPRLLNLVRTRLTPHFCSHYGSTETGLIAVATAEMLARHPDSAGSMHLPCVAIEIVDPAGHPLDSGVIGEVRIRSRHMPAGYLNDTIASADRFRDGWFYPGDIGHFDVDGRLYLHGRSDNVINIGGHKTTAEHVEEVIELDEAILEAAVLPVDDGEGGLALAAFVVLGLNMTLDGVSGRCAARLGVLTPKWFYKMDTLPRTESGKISRNRLRDLLQPVNAKPN